MAALAVEREHVDRPLADPGDRAQPPPAALVVGRARSTRPAATSARGAAQRERALRREPQRARARPARSRRASAAEGRSRRPLPASSRPEAADDPALDRDRALVLDQLLADRPAERLERLRPPRDAQLRAARGPTRRSADRSGSASWNGPQVVVDAEREAHARDRLLGHVAALGPRAEQRRGRARAGRPGRAPARRPRAAAARAPRRGGARPRPSRRGSRSGQAGRTSRRTAITAAVQQVDVHEERARRRDVRARTSRGGDPAFAVACARAGAATTTAGRGAARRTTRRRRRPAGARPARSCAAPAARARRHDDGVDLLGVLRRAGRAARPAPSAQGYRPVTTPGARSRVWASRPSRRPVGGRRRRAPGAARTSGSA